MNIQAMMKQAQKLQKDMMSEKEKIDQTEYVGTSSFVTVTVMGDKKVKSIKIDSKSIEEDEIEMLEDMIVAAINEAMKQADEASGAMMNKMTGGLGGFPF